MVHRLRPSSSRSRHVALAFPMGLAHLQPLVQGITDYTREHGRWMFTTSPETVMLSVQSLGGWQGDGVIAVLVNQADVRAAKELRLPLVTFSGALRDPGFPRVSVDNRALGRLAAEHLLACGFQRFGYYGLRNVAYAQDRGAGFEEALLEHVGPGCCRTHLSPNTFTASHPWQNEVERLDRWVSELEPPVGLLATSDQRARMLVEACQRVGLRVPQDVGVLGVDNDLVVCEFGEPALSSIACDWYQVGVRSAMTLDRLMDGEPVEKADQLVAPLGVVRRRSTDVLVVEHAAVARAVQYVREHLSEPFGVETLLEEAKVSRRSLELGFRRSLDCTPYEFLCRARVDRAKHLLAAPGRVKLTDVAAACGFTDLRRLRLVFMRCEGVTPGAYRREILSNRGEAAPPPVAASADSVVLETRSAARGGVSGVSGGIGDD